MKVPFFRQYLIKYSIMYCKVLKEIITLHRD